MRAKGSGRQRRGGGGEKGVHHAHLIEVLRCQLTVRIRADDAKSLQADRHRVAY